MKNLRGKRGITLVALIITIIVLLILAVVAISAVSGDGIINYAKNAKSAYQEASVNENATLESYMNMLNNYNNTTTSNLIQFTIDGTTYYAETGWDWEYWMTTSYNTIGVIINDAEGCLEFEGKCLMLGGEGPILPTAEIVGGGSYVTGGNLPS